MTILLTGAAGFIGRHLARHLAARGKRVWGVGHGTFSTHSLWGLSRWVQGDITGANLDSASQGEVPTYIYHLAGGSSVGPSLERPREDFQRTLVSTANLLDWMRRSAPSARLIAVSSAAIYGASHNGKIEEHAAAAPLSPYGAHKAMMEMLIQAHGLAFGIQAVVARPFSVYGDGLAKQLLWDLGRRLLSEEMPTQLGGTGAELRDWIHVEDVVSGLERLADATSTATPSFNIGSGLPVSVEKVANLLADAMGRPSTIAFSGHERPGNPMALVSNPLRLMKLGWQPSVPLERGIYQYASWLKAQKS